MIHQVLNVLCLVYGFALLSFIMFAALTNQPDLLVKGIVLVLASCLVALIPQAHES